MVRSSILFFLQLFILTSCIDEGKPHVLNMSPIYLPKYKACRLNTMELTLGEQMKNIVNSIDTVKLWTRDKNIEEYRFPYNLSFDLKPDRLRCFRKVRYGSINDSEELLFLDNLLMAYYYRKDVMLGDSSYNEMKNKIYSIGYDKIPFIFEDIRNLKHIKQEYKYKDYSIEIFFESSTDRENSFDFSIVIQYNEKLLRSKLFK